MAGVLSFTLGLEASKFLSTLNLASGQILGFAGAMNGLGRIVEGVWAAIERGGALTDLSNRTGESVRNLYQLQESFKVVGVGGENVAPMLLRMQKALSGVDEAGQSTVDIFGALNIDLSQLRGMDAPRQIATLAQALKSLPREQAVGLASRLFGREGAGNFLQIARDFKGFQESMRDSAASAAVFARTAAVFDDIGDKIATIKMKIGGMWAGIAEGAAPTIKSILNWINKFDWVGLGQKIGGYINAAFRMIRSGELAQFLSLGFQAATQTFANYLHATIAGAAAYLVTVFSNAFKALTAEMNGDHGLVSKLLESFRLDMLGNANGLLGLWDLAGSEMHVPGANAKYIERDRLAEDYWKASSEVLASTDPKAPGRILASTFAGSGKAFADAFWASLAKGDNTYIKAFSDQLNKYKLDFAAAGNQTKGGDAKFDAIVGKRLKADDVSEWEKMGFVMRGGESMDYARTTAENTRTANHKLQQIYEVLKSPNPQTSFTGIE